VLLMLKLEPKQRPASGPARNTQGPRRGGQV
jgi:hypothetical protein